MYGFSVGKPTIDFETENHNMGPEGQNDSGLTHKGGNECFL